MAAEEADEDLIYQFKSGCANLDINVPKSISSLTDTLDTIAVQLGRSEELRIRIGSFDQFLWKDLRRLWHDLVRAQLTFWDGEEDDEGDDDHAEKDKQRSLRLMCAALARFTRNLVAGVPKNQQKAFENEPDVRRLLHYYTSWTAVEDPDMVLVARVLIQALSNMVTGNESLMDRLWEMYLKLREDQVILIRLLTTPDRRTQLATLILIRNCIQGSKTRTKLLARSTIGTRICVFLLDCMVNLYDEEEDSDGAKAFDVGYDIFTRIMELGLVPSLYARMTMTDETVTPHQTTLLKLVDSYLQAVQLSSTHSESVPDKARSRLCSMLAGCFLSMSAHAIRSIQRSLKQPDETFAPDPSSLNVPPSELDVMLPKVCEALVLVAQCMISLLLEAEDRLSEQRSTADGSSPNAESNPQAYFTNKRDESGAIIENLIEVMRLLDTFLPRIIFGKRVSGANGKSEMEGFSYLKRDLVRLLGLLSYENKTVQDRTRLCGGLEAVLNLCVVDERNPFLREHAIFTLRNLLKDNPDNQLVVAEIQPMGEWDSQGVLQDWAGVTRR